VTICDVVGGGVLNVDVTEGSSFINCHTLCGHWLG